MNQIVATRKLNEIVAALSGEINATPRGGRKTAQASHVATWSVEAGDSGHSVGGATSLVMPEADYLARPASTRHPASVILTRATSNLRAPATTRSATARPRAVLTLSWEGTAR